MKVFDKTKIKGCVAFKNPITNQNKMTTWHGDYVSLFIQMTPEFIDSRRDCWEGDGEIMLSDVNSETIENAYEPEVYNACPQETGWLRVTVLV